MSSPSRVGMGEDRVGEDPANFAGRAGSLQTVDVADLAAVRDQLGRVPRGVAAVAHRCPCGSPDVLRTEPRLPDGTPFPTTYYATCPRLTGAISTLETSGMMAAMTRRLGSDPELASAYVAAHDDYLRRRGELGDVAEIAGISAGGMPTRVKCLHVLVGHSLAVGAGVNPLGDEALAALGDWWAKGPCVARADAVTGDEQTSSGDLTSSGDVMSSDDQRTSGDVMSSDDQTTTAPDAKRGDT